MRGLFLIKDGANYMEFHNYDDIPMSFDNLIRFEPEVIPEPHTEEQHELMESYNDKLKELMKRERM
jgi:hypothetical protein